MKIVTIGGGSTYTPELAQGFIERHQQLGIREWWLMDIDARRLEVVGGFVKRMVGAAGNPFEVYLTIDRQAAMKGADFIITQIRVGGMNARREDEYLGRRWGLIGQETTGIGGMANGLRTAPVILSIAEDMCELCPDAWLVNFTNPSGLVVEALKRYAPKVHSVGLCNGPIGYQMTFANKLGLNNPFNVHLDYLGLNHLAWIQGARVGSQDIWPQILKEEGFSISADIMKRLGVICNYYLQYYYNTQSVLKGQVENQTSRAEQVMEIDKRLLEQYADPTLNTVPRELMERGGAYYSTACVHLIEAIILDLGQEHIVNTRQGDAVPGIPPEWVMELPCRVGRDGIHPLPAKPLPLFADGLLRAVKAYELFTVQAACTGDRTAALKALTVHPLGPDIDQAIDVLDDMLKTHQAYLPNFFENQ